MANHINNKWREKMNQVQVPDESLTWNQMEVLLDKHLPHRKQTNYCYVYLTLLLLLLIVGICNCPDLKTGSTAYHSNGSKKQPEEKPVNDRKSLIDKNDSEERLDSKQDSLSHVKSNHTFGNSENNFRGAPRYSSNKRGYYIRKDKWAGITSKKGSKNPFSPRRKSANKVAVSQSNLRKAERKFESAESPDVVNHSTTHETPLSHVDTPLTTSAKANSTKDTVTGSASSKEKNQFKPKKHMIGIGAGFNYFLPVNNQEGTFKDANGANNAWSTFIPVLMGRYYFSERFYLQSEFQFNAAQYTSKILLDKQVVNNPGPGASSVRRVETSIFTKKLFYIDLPVSLNVSPVKNFFLGAGIQYSHLQKALGLYEEKTVVIGRRDSITSIQFKRIDPSLAGATLKANDWRYVINGMVKVNKFNIGMRYTRAFDPFLKAPPNTSTSETTNSSLLIFLRYELMRIK